VAVLCIMGHSVGEASDGSELTSSVDLKYENK
jgi:hypothetical protein